MECPWQNNYRRGQSKFLSPLIRGVVLRLFTQCTHFAPLRILSPWVPHFHPLCPTFVLRHCLKKRWEINWNSSNDTCFSVIVILALICFVNHRKVINESCVIVRFHWWAIGVQRIQILDKGK